MSRFQSSFVASEEELAVCFCCSCGENWSLQTDGKYPGWNAKGERHPTGRARARGSQCVCVQTLRGHWYSHQGLSLFLFKNCYIFMPGSAELLLWQQVLFCRQLFYIFHFTVWLFNCLLHFCFPFVYTLLLPSFSLIQDFKAIFPLYT